MSLLWYESAEANFLSDVIISFNYSPQCLCQKFFHISCFCEISYLSTEMPVKSENILATCLSFINLYPCSYFCSGINNSNVFARVFSSSPHFYVFSAVWHGDNQTPQTISAPFHFRLSAANFATLKPLYTNTHTHTNAHSFLQSKGRVFCLIPCEVYLLSPNVNTHCWQTQFPPIIQRLSTS